MVEGSFEPDLRHPTAGTSRAVPRRLQHGGIQLPCQHQQAFQEIVIRQYELALVRRVMWPRVRALVEATLREYPRDARVSRRSRRARYFVTSAFTVASATPRYLERDAGSFATLESFNNALDAAAVAAVSRSVLGIAGSSKSQNATWSLGTCAIHSSPRRAEPLPARTPPPGQPYSSWWRTRYPKPVPGPRYWSRCSPCGCGV